MYDSTGFVQTGTVLNRQYILENNKTLDFEVRDSAVGLIFTSFVLSTCRRCWIFWGGNNSGSNPGQKPAIIALHNGNGSTDITIAPSDVSGKYNHILLKNTTGYSIYVFICANKVISYNIS
jgi:hypothetical protein